MTTSLHPQNARVGNSGSVYPPGLDYHRFPPVFVTEHGEKKHETPLCPHVRGRVHYAICREDALFAYGENRCRTCRQYSTDLSGHPFAEATWTDPRYRIDDEDTDDQ